MDVMHLTVEKGHGDFWAWHLQFGERDCGGIAITREQAWEFAFKKRAVILGSMRIAAWIRSMMAPRT